MIAHVLNINGFVQEWIPIVTLMQILEASVVPTILAQRRIVDQQRSPKQNHAQWEMHYWVWKTGSKQLYPFIVMLNCGFLHMDTLLNFLMTTKRWKESWLLALLQLMLQIHSITHSARALKFYVSFNKTINTWWKFFFSLNSFLIQNIDFTSGTTKDYVYDSLDVIHAYTLELRQTDDGFVTPSTLISPVATEAWNGIKAMANAII